MLDQDGVGRFVLFGDTPGYSEGFQLRIPTGLMGHEEDSLLGLVGVGDRGLGKDGQGFLLYPVDDDYVGGGLLLSLLGHREQRALIQNTPP